MAQSFPVFAAKTKDKLFFNIGGGNYCKKQLFAL